MVRLKGFGGGGSAVVRSVCGYTCRTLDCRDGRGDIAAGMKVHRFGDISEMESTRVRSFCWL